MAAVRLLQAASRRLRVGVGLRAASDDARIVERATRGQVAMRQFGIEGLGGAGMHAPHVAIFGAGFVGVNTALALLQRNIASRVTLTDVDKEKCLGEVLDLEDAGTPGSILCASPWEAGLADVIVITAGRGAITGRDAPGADQRQRQNHEVDHRVEGRAELNQTSRRWPVKFDFCTGHLGPTSIPKRRLL